MNNRGLNSSEEWQRLESILNFIPTPVLLIEPGTAKVIFSNKAANELSGGKFPQGENAENYHKLYCCYKDGKRIPDNEMPGVRAARGERLVNVSIDWETTSGRKSLLINSDVIKNSSGKEFIIIVFQDVSFQQHALDKLKDTHDQLAAILESIPEGVIVYDKNGDLLFANDVAAVLTGFLSEGELGSPINRKDFFTRIYEHINILDEEGTLIPTEKLPSRRIFAGEKHAEMKAWFVNKQDSARKWIYVKSRPFCDKEDNLLMVVTSLTDITDLKHAEESINEEKEKFATLANNISQLAWMADQSGNVFWYNKQWFNFTGTTFSDMQRAGWESVIAPDHKMHVITFIAQAWKKGEPWELTFPIRRADGEYLWFLTRAYAIKDEKGNVIRWIGTNTNIDEQQKALKEKDDFIGIASHELKTPLTSLKAYIQLLERRLKDPQQKKYVIKTNQFVNKLQSLIGSLLDVSKIHSGKLEFDFRDFRLEPLIDETIESISVIYPDYKIVKEGSLENRFVSGDRMHLEQVMVNLLTNAIKYSPDEHEVIVRLGLNGNDCEVSVIDKGVGIAAEKQDKLFERFYRANDDAHKFTGLGIGLYISREIIKRHNGEIGVESEKDKGSRFWFTLPSLPMKQRSSQ